MPAIVAYTEKIIGKFEEKDRKLPPTLSK